MSEIGKGEKGKREGMERVERHADPEWRLAADIAVLEAARCRKTLTTDDVVTRIPKNFTTHNMKALGPVMRSAASQGIIEQSSERPKKCATRPNNHCRPLTVWSSLLYSADP
jgi:hypothetical protein